MPTKTKLRPASEFGFRAPSAHSQHAAGRTQFRASVHKPLHVMKFGGTSVGDASRIERVAEIVSNTARECHLIVVVSAMSGVTNKLMEAAAHSEAGNSALVAAVFRNLRAQHEQVADALISSAAERSEIGQRMRRLFHEGEYLCQAAILAKEVTPQTRDSIASLGERLSAPLVAATLARRGIKSEAIAATELILTDANYGAADPYMDATREQCEARLRPLLHQGLIPVVTGFIGATIEGVLTTLGRGGSDYSATILGAALEADEVIIWTDVDGVLTADPRLVPEARTIAELSYHEAADLAHFGAKVLHPKTLQPVMQSKIPVRIRNSFAPEQLGTRIRPAETTNRSEVCAITTINEAQLVTVGGSRTSEVRNALGRASAAVSAVRADAWLTAHTASHHKILVAVNPALAAQVAKAMREEFAEEFAEEKLEAVNVEATIAIVTLVGQALNNTSDFRERAVASLQRTQIEVIAVGEEFSGRNLSLVVAQHQVNEALVVLHQEFRLGQPDPQAVPVKIL
jgi:aspartokinase/homoserine dehydrogenase 1